MDLRTMGLAALPLALWLTAGCHSDGPAPPPAPVDAAPADARGMGDGLTADLAPPADLATGFMDLSEGRFPGLWLVDQPTHALYEATYYELRSDGVLRTGRAEPPGCTGHLSKHCVTGSVANADMTITCVFGDRWAAPDARTLHITGRCSDGRARQIALDFVTPRASDGKGADVAVKSVAGEAGWRHDNWPWRFLRCPAGSDERSCGP